MGWWATTVMGGDTPLDWEAEIFEALSINLFAGEDDQGDYLEETYQEHVARVKARFTQEGLDAAWDVVRDAKYDEVIAYQVLGVIIMKYGFPITQEQKQVIIDYAKWDEWAQDDAEESLYPDWVNENEVYEDYDPTQADFIRMFNSSERGRHILTFIATLDRYDGSTPTELSDADTGLFAAIAEHIESGKTGLVNKIPGAGY